MTIAINGRSDVNVSDTEDCNALTVDVDTMMSIRGSVI